MDGNSIKGKKKGLFIEMNSLNHLLENLKWFDTVFLSQYLGLDKQIEEIFFADLTAEIHPKE